MGSRIAQLFIEIDADGKAAVNELNKVKGAMESTGKAGMTMGQSLQLGMKSFAAASATALGVGVAAKKAYDQTVKVFLDYSMAVKEMTRLTGMSTEESSRFIQVADDMFISQESLTRSLEFAARKGIDPSIKSITKLADQYLRLEPGLERDQFLMEIFGKTGMDMAALLEIGADGIISAWSGVPDALVLDDAAVQSAYELKTSLDTLSDSFQALKVAAGEEAAPALLKVTNGLNTIIDLQDTKKDNLAEASANVYELSASYNEYSDALDDNAKKLLYHVDTEGNLINIWGQVVQKSYKLSQAEWDVAKASQYLGEQAGFAQEKMQDFNGEMYASKYAAESVAPVLDDYKSKYMVNRSVKWIVNFEMNGGNPDASYNYMIDGVVDPNLLRAGGGDVSGNTSYIVGERGPELMMPGASGQVISNERIIQALADLQMNRNVTVNQNLNMGMSGDLSSLPGIATIMRQRAGRF